MAGSGSRPRRGSAGAGGRALASNGAAQATPASFTSTEPGGGERMRGRIVNSSSPATPQLRPEAAAR
jgi:hypothetical protein